MRSKNHKAISSDESEHIGRVKAMDCIVCGAPGPSEAHHPEQQLHYIVIPLCKPCHGGTGYGEGWHGTRLRWSLRKMTELKAINETYRRLNQ